MVFFFNVSKTLCENHTSKKSSGPFLSFFGKSAENSVADFLGGGDFSGATFAFCGRDFGRWQH
jgi:hypothetical protein